MYVSVHRYNENELTALLRELKLFSSFTFEACPQSVLLWTGSLQREGGILRSPYSLYPYLALLVLPATH